MDTNQPSQHAAHAPKDSATPSARAASPFRPPSPRGLSDFTGTAPQPHGSGSDARVRTPHPVSIPSPPPCEQSGHVRRCARSKLRSAHCVRRSRNARTCERTHPHSGQAGVRVCACACACACVFVCVRVCASARNRCRANGVPAGMLARPKTRALYAYRREALWPPSATAYSRTPWPTGLLIEHRRLRAPVLLPLCPRKPVARTCGPPAGCRHGPPALSPIRTVARVPVAALVWFAHQQRRIDA